MHDLDPLPGSLNLSFVEGIYSDFLAQPDSVPPQWRRYFEQMRNDEESHLPTRIGPSFKPRSLFNPLGMNSATTAAEPARITAAPEMDVAARQDRVDQLIRNYRIRGHRVAHLDPLAPQVEYYPEDLDPASFGFTEEDLDREFSTVTIRGDDVRTLRRIVRRLRNTYCRFIGVQFMHIDDMHIREWLLERMEGTENRVQLSRSEQLRVLTSLTDAVIFEEFIQKKFLGAKSFSLEGAESLIPLLDLAIEKAGSQGVQEIVLGMAHRGRLNVLANIMGKDPQQIFREFADVDPHLHQGRGDVKYHLGYSSDHQTNEGKNVHLTLCFNPSHLEFVDPVAMGRTRAKQDRFGDTERTRALTVLVHGDAAFAGEGVIQETLNMSQLKAYGTGGTLHIIVNNQIGFTTPPNQARSGQYATEVAKMLQIPIFHVNGEHPESVVQVVRLALEFRQTFKRDVVIDMYCYRRKGHNETDEPAFTQPLLYGAIAQKETVRESYLDHLLLLGGITVDEADWIADRTREHLEHELSVARGDDYKFRLDSLGGLWKSYVGGADADVPDVDTTYPEKKLKDLIGKLTELPVGFTPHPKIEKLLKTRAQMADGTAPIDWAMAEALAFASLSVDGVRIRMSGQDVERGTFSHRHAAVHDIVTGQKYMSLQHLSPKQASVEIDNSLLSETGVMGFEYGYSLDTPDGLVIWEAQFGDFCNVAQVIIDQFIVSAEDKWRRLSGLVLLLPHGMEGQGPEHSSARMERFLSLAAQDNIQVVNLTTPAQYFHCLRRQILRKIRKPLIVMSPKSLLRDPRVVSPLSDLSTGAFQRVIPDQPPSGKKKKIKRVLLCSGKVYFDLVKHREEQKISDVAIVRLEQIYPTRMSALMEALAPYAPQTPVVWVQEEPGNMGAWPFLRVKHGERLYNQNPFSGVFRPRSASPATGSASSHKLEQQKLIEEAFAGL